MKIITLSKIGYNAPRQTNWNWGIWKVDTIDTENLYCMSYIVKENFGGDSRLRREIPKIIETKSRPIKPIKMVRSSTCIPMLLPSTTLKSLLPSIAAMMYW